MKKTYVTKMPNHIGAFLKASKCFSELGINITRVSYNKAVDSHTLFIEVDGEVEQLKKANEKLNQIGYLSNEEENDKIVLIEFRLKDEPGSVTSVLELIGNFNFNISYISSQENGSGFQQFKMGLYVNDANSLTKFLTQAEKLCEIKIIDYNNTERIFDNKIFYNSYVDGLVKTAGLSKDKKEELSVNVNLVMQTLDEQGLSPYKTFDSISKFAELLALCKGENFNPRITKYDITEKTKITIIEPDCGSNTAIIESDGERIFIDSGYACYKEEMLKVIKSIVPDFKKRSEKILITHADVDHCGLINEFDTVVLSERSYESLVAEINDNRGFRELNPLHLPYIQTCKILTDYKLAEQKKLLPLWDKSTLVDAVEKIGDFKLGELNFEVFEGKGGHLRGEVILLDFNLKVAFTGDVLVNLAGLTKKQAEYNQYAPILMTSVDTDKKLCSEERVSVLEKLTTGKWNVFGGHGQSKEINIP